MTETAAAEAVLDLRIATASPGPYFFNPALAAVALSLARALREEVRNNPMHAIQGHAADRCDSCSALADWDTMLQSMDVVE